MSPTGSRVFPAYHVFAGVAELDRLTKTEIISTGRKEVAALAGILANGTRIIWLANLAPEEVEVETESSETGKFWKVKDLNETNVASAIREPEAWMQTAAEKEFLAGRSKLLIPPYGLVRLNS